jgi:hypothetical protein
LAELRVSIVLLRNDLIASDSNGRFIRTGNWRNRVRNPAVATVGLGGIPDRGILRRTPNDGRRSFASALIHEVRSAVEVAGQLGHSSASTMLCHYARVVEAARASDRVPLSDAVAGLRETRAKPARRQLRLVSYWRRNTPINRGNLCKRATRLELATFGLGSSEFPARRLRSRRVATCRCYPDAH